MNNEKLTGYASVDKPWLKYYPEGAENRPLPQKTLYQQIYESNKDHFGDYAFNYFGKRITYRTLFENIDKAAKALVSLGVKPHDIVTIMGLSVPETFYVAYACNKIGAIINLISVLAGEQELVHYLNEAKSEIFIALDLFNDKIIKTIPQTGVKTVVNMSLAESMPLHVKAVFKLKATVQKCKDFTSWKDFLALAEGKPEAEVYPFKPNRFSYLAHTRGTTGEPKGVMLSDEALNGVAYDHLMAMNCKRQDRYLNTIVPFVVYGFLINTHAPLIHGFEVYLIPKAETSLIIDRIVNQKINIIATVPTILESLVNNECFRNSDLSSICNIGTGGDGMNNTLEENLNDILEKNHSNAKLSNGYGLSETTTSVCRGTESVIYFGSVGIPLSRVVISSFNLETYNENKFGEIGEICINTPYLMLGYLNNQEATDEVVKIHKDGNKWFHTGDLGYITEEGAVYITGRIKRIILTEKDGMVSKIFPDHVEKLINSYEPTEASCVVKQGGDSPEIKLTAYVVLKEQYRLDTASVEATLRELCAAELPEYSVPSKYVFIDNMPLTAVGKIDFRNLEEREKGDNNV